MNTPRLLAISLLISGCVASAAAQTAPVPKAAPASPGPYVLAAPAQVRSFIRETPQAEPKPFAFQAQPLTTLPDPATDQILLQRIDKAILKAEQSAKQGVCYTMRSYSFTRDSADRESTKPSGVTTCTAATASQARNAGAAHPLLLPLR